jgi:hypothetical protein
VPCRCAVPYFELLISQRQACILQAGVTPALALGALTSSAAAACGVRGGQFTETYVCDFSVLQLPLKPPPPAGPPPSVAVKPPSDCLHSLDLEALVLNLASKKTRVLGVFMDGKCVFT